MHTLIVTAHPDKSSYTHAVVSRLVAGLETRDNDTYEVVDLIAEGFDPRFTAADNDFYDGRAEPGADVLAEQQRLDRADVLVLVFPIYWWSMPAVMKGWIDRVFTTGWAFIDDPDKGTTRLLGRLKGQVIAVGGSHRGTYDRRGYLDAIKKQILEGIFGFCGMGVIGLDLLLPMDSESENEGLQNAFEIGRRLSGEQL
ncbi:NAD(P)H-dependent oxidoreductase [Methylobacterium nodulans]|uniref:NAD(P)H dehydrogenase (Quinone) n=1 Tax=Methylobacterium nodulans (strain LMG 21967 / CNCM I-2342 / ORS 2060) TaxID=460265 RepID=B8IIH3_METNO|nr:NAD(P)H-dependent oxidoreductase [Methylobacterium nodulans]ACL59850.1 NAD(P)H dehydrogenase (quinone) [Methylobacterium nodulans ORS 2060]